MVLEQLMLGVAVVVVVVLLLPFLLVMAGIGAAVLLWCVASAAILGVLVFWLVFPGLYGAALRCCCSRSPSGCCSAIGDIDPGPARLKGRPPLARAASIQLHRSDL